MSSPPVKPIDLAAVVPGGIWSTDHVHDPGYDETCIRCRTQIADDDVPLLVWLPPDQRRMLAYCRYCTRFDGDNPRADGMGVP